MTYPTIITYPRHADGWFHLRGGPHIRLGEHSSDDAYFDPDEIRRAALDFPFLDPARAFGEWTHHVLQNPCGQPAHCSPMGHIYYGALVSGRESDEWMWQTVGHELGHVFWFRYMPDHFQTHYARLVKPLLIPGWTADDCFAEDFRFATGGPLLRAIPHQLRRWERDWRGWEDVVALVREAIMRARLWQEEMGLNSAEPAGEDAQDEEEPPSGSTPRPTSPPVRSPTCTRRTGRWTPSRGCGMRASWWGTSAASGRTCWYRGGSLRRWWTGWCRGVETLLRARRDYCGDCREGGKVGKMTCKLCQERGKTWDGADPQCAFESDVFSPDNWNCATMNTLRDIAESLGTTMHRDLDDASIGYVPLGDDGEYSGYVVMTWYKNRGRTGNALIMWDDEPVEELTEAAALQAIAWSRGVEAACTKEEG